MIKTTLRAIESENATDITEWAFAQLSELHRTANIIKIAYSIGIYGLNGLLFVDRYTGEYYKITDRTAALCMFS